MVGQEQKLLCATLANASEKRIVIEIHNFLTSVISSEKFTFLH